MIVRAVLFQDVHDIGRGIIRRRIVEEAGQLRLSVFAGPHLQDAGRLAVAVENPDGACFQFPGFLVAVRIADDEPVPVEDKGFADRRAGRLDPEGEGSGREPFRSNVESMQGWRGEHKKIPVMALQETTAENLRQAACFPEGLPSMRGSGMPVSAVPDGCGQDCGGTRAAGNRYFMLLH
ncbi:hypothetical protein [Shinella granuli]|uniref:hypothetical protein n=1 Tax=Shinella granuli TaxID=323621 RepID=UPI0013C32669|nr:hypothetical protein [Shinella granuli]